MSDGAARAIVVRGARTHNLADVTVTLPRGRLVAICGPSGAGKSSLAFDTIYAEAQRRYLEALGHVPGVSRLPRPDVDAVLGLPAAVAVGQRGIGRSARSTLGTTTEVLDVLRVLFARLASAHCPVCRRPLVAETAQQIVDAILARPAGTKLTVLAPLVRKAKGDPGPTLARLAEDGFVRARVDGVLVDLSAPPPFDPKKPHDVEAVVDRLAVKEGVRARLADSVELGLRLGQGRLSVAYEGGDTVAFAARLLCAHDEGSLPSPTPALFSANHPDGACAGCGGLGVLPQREPDEREDAEPAEPSAPRTCPDCGGARLSRPARCFTLGGLPLDALLALPLPAAAAHLESVRRALPTDVAEAVGPLFELAGGRLSALVEAGLGHLALGRGTDTLSSGERMRARLATQIGTGLAGVLYVLDEPSIGQSVAEVERLLGLLHGLVARGNDVIVVDHDPTLLRAADYVVDVGPAAGRGGGRVVAEGPPATLGGVTGPWLRGEVELPAVTSARRAPVKTFAVEDARLRNLRGLSVTVEAGTLTAVAGPSGAGKSALLEAFAVAHASVAVRVDDAPLGRTSRASAATALGVLPRLRDLFAQLPEAKARGYKASRFSLHAKGGRCEACLGEGTTRLELVLLPDARVSCPVCLGARYDRETLEVRYRGLSMADVLALSVEDAERQFEAFPKIRGPLEALRSVGLGYLALGQPASTLSGGEAQRVKLARGLAQGRSGKGTLWLLDEPTVGLHPSDVAKLLEALVALRDQGDTVLVAEHDPALIARCDAVIELGPGAGAEGGSVVTTRRRA